MSEWKVIVDKLRDLDTPEDKIKELVPELSEEALTIGRANIVKDSRSDGVFDTRHLENLDYLRIQCRGKTNDITRFVVMGTMQCSSSSTSTSTSSSSWYNPPCDSSDSSTSCEPSVSPSSAESSPSSKLAITRFGSKWISWTCSEDPEPMFSDTMEVQLGPDGFGAVAIPLEMLQSTKPGTLRVESILPDTLSYHCGTILRLGPNMVVAVKAQRMGWFRKKPKSATVRISGVRKDADVERWEEKTLDEVNQNAHFWRNAFVKLS